MITRSLCFITSATFLAMALPVSAETQFAKINVVQNDAGNALTSVTLTKSAGSSTGFTIPATGHSRGDYFTHWGTTNDLTSGVMISCVAQNGRDDSAKGNTFGVFYATSGAEYNLSAGALVNRYYIPIFRAAQGDEVNINVAAAFFPYSETLGGFARNEVNGGAMTTLASHSSIRLGTEFVDNTGGLYTLDLRAQNATGDNGIMLVCGGKNEDNYALSRANADGTFTLITKDNGSNSTSYERDPIAFAYVPLSKVGTGPLVAAGRVNGNGTFDVGSGKFTVARTTNAGEWLVKVPGYSETNGVLIVSPEGGVGNNADNIVSYEWNAASSGWLIQTRDLSDDTTLPTSQGTANDEDAFSFAFYSGSNAAFAPPTVSLTTADGQSSYVTGNPVTLTATAADTDGTVAKVQFYDGVTFLGEDTSAPFQWTATAPVYGTHAYRAVATDDSAAVATSSTISVLITPPAGSGGLFFDGIDDYATFGTNTALNLTQFTLECWFKRVGTGLTASTGSGGVTAVPLITKGVGENDSATFNCNYFLGINAAGLLVADFEEGPGGGDLGLNHPVTGVTAVPMNVWQHAAVTYDGTTWKLYLNGALETTLVVGQPAGFDSIQHAAIGTAQNSTGTPSGAFLGHMDEVRIWNVARTQSEILDARDIEVPETTGLVGRWDMAEGTGGTITSTAAGNVTGTLTNGPVWAEGAPLTDNVLPAVSLTSPVNGAVFVLGDQVDLEATATDSDGHIMKVEFFDGATKIAEGSAAPFSGEWIAEGAGTHVLTARATDDDDGSSISIPVTLSVLPPAGSGALYFDGVDDHVTFGDAAALKLSAFTLETWVLREAGGVGAGTGSGGVTGIPLITKGRGENDNNTFNCNYFFGISPTTGALVADFEEGPSGASPGLNHPITGTKPLTIGEWHHVAVTYDGTTWKLYVDGILDTSLQIGRPVADNSIQHAALGSAQSSTGATEGFFHGWLDETRIWNSARTESEIQSVMNSEITASIGLVARWGMTEGSGTTLASTAGTPVNGTLTNGPLWTVGAPLTHDVPPTVMLSGPTDGALNQPLDVTLKALVNDTDSSSLNVTFYARESGPALVGNEFSIVALPDTQYYSAAANGGSPAIFSAQTDWIVNERNARNIQFVLHLGDITDHGDIHPTTNLSNEPEWLNAINAMYRLENPATTLLPDGMPYCVCVGNHDQTPNGNADGTTNFYNQYFGIHPTTGISHFAGKPYYGGTQIPEKADNYYTLFTAGGLDFICVSFEYDTTPDLADLAWADALLKTYPTRRAIIITHHTVNTGNPATFSPLGSAIYQALKTNPNLMMLHGGHIHGEGRRTDTYAGRTVHSILADYQGRTRGGDGWLRILKFSPSENKVRVQTYSPTLNQFETDADSQFTLDVDLQSGLGAFTQIGTQTNVTPGSTASFTWTGRDPGKRYEWYAVVSDGTTSINSASATFTTGGVLYPPTVSLTAPVSGSSYTQPASITLEATAADTDGTVSKVEFFSGTTFLGEDTTAPYAFNWTNVGIGSYTILAKATDSDGQVTTSEPISVLVHGEPAAPATNGYSAGLFNGNWVVAKTTPAPRHFNLPGSNTGDIALKINGVSVPYTSGLALATNWNNPGNGAATSEDNIVSPYQDASGNLFVKVLDNANNNASTDNPATTEESSGTAVAYLPFANGWVGAIVAETGVITASNLPAGISVSKSGTGLYSISGLSPTGNLLAFTQANAPSTNADNLISVRFTSGTWIVETRDNAGGAQDGSFAFVYVPSSTTGIYSGTLSRTGVVTKLNPTLTNLGATATLNAGSIDITFGDGSVINPDTAALFLTADSTSTNAGLDNVHVYSANGNAFRIFSQDLPEVNGSFQAIDFRFLVLPLTGDAPNVVTITATDATAGEYGADQALSFTLSRTSDASQALVVPLVASGTATAGSDYSGLTANVTIPAGSTTVSLTLTVLTDSLSEGTETVTLSLGTSANFSPGTPASATASITDRPSQSWYAENLPGSPLQGPLDDADGDGLENVLEYFMGTQPGNGGSLPVTKTAVNGNSVTFTYPRALNRADVTGAVEWSTNLTQWYRSGQSNGAVTLNITESTASLPAADPQLIQATATPASGPLPKEVFFRLTVTP